MTYRSGVPARILPERPTQHYAPMPGSTIIQVVCATSPFNVKPETTVSVCSVLAKIPKWVERVPMVTTKEDHYAQLGHSDPSSWRLVDSLAAIGVQITVFALQVDVPVLVTSPVY